MGYEGEEVSGSWSTRTKTGRLCSENDGKPIGMQKQKKKENVVLASSLSWTIFVSVVRQQPLVDVVIMIKAKEELRVTSSAREEQQALKAI